MLSSDNLAGAEARRGELPLVAGHGRSSRCEVERARHGGEFRRWSWYEAVACSDLEMTAMWWWRSAAMQRGKEDSAVGEMVSAV
jgi:hypothetical protein